MTLRDGIFECRKILMRIPFILHILLLGICAVAQVAAPQGIQTFKFGDCKVVCIQDALMRLPVPQQTTHMVGVQVGDEYTGDSFRGYPRLLEFSTQRAAHLVVSGIYEKDVPVFLYKEYVH